MDCDYNDFVLAAELVRSAWCDKFATDCPPSSETVCFWLETTPPELVLQGIEHAYESRVPNSYLLADLVRTVDDFITGPEPPGVDEERFGPNRSAD